MLKLFWVGISGAIFFLLLFFYVCNGTIFCVFSNRPEVAKPFTCDEPRRSHGDDQLRLRLSMSPHKHSTPTQSSPQARRQGRYRLSATRSSREEERQSEEEQRTPVSAAVHEVRWLCVALRRLSLAHPAASTPLVSLALSNTLRKRLFFWVDGATNVRHTNTRALKLTQPKSLNLVIILAQCTKHFAILFG